MCDRIRYPIIISIFGNFFMAVALSLVGPAPFIPTEPSVALILVRIHFPILPYEPKMYRQQLWVCTSPDKSLLERSNAVLS